MTITRAVIWGIAALAGASLLQSSLAMAQTSPQPSAAEAGGQAIEPLLRPNEAASTLAATGSVSEKTDDEKASISNTTVEADIKEAEKTEAEKMDAGNADTNPVSSLQPSSGKNTSGAKPAIVEQDATAQNIPAAQSPSQITPADTAQENNPKPVQPASNADDNAVVQPEAEIQITAQPETETETQIAGSEPEAVKIDPKDIKLKIATWSGAYGQSQERAIIKPFADKTGYQVETVIYDGSAQAFEEQRNNPEWNVVDLNGADMFRACNEGRLERLDQTLLEAAPGDAPISADFLPGAIHKCGIGSMAWSAVLVTDTRLEDRPGSLKDFFDISKFPGKRILPKQPRYSLELALMADGVAPENVYDILRTPEGQNRAFGKLSSIKDEIIWWDDPAEVIAMILNKEAIIGLTFNGRAFMSIVASGRPLEIIWDHQIYSYDYWAIPRGAEFQDAAKAFIGDATAPKALAEQANWLPYGPSRRSAAALVDKHPELGIDMKSFLPTYEANFSNALGMDHSFWDLYEISLKERFAEWVQDRQLPPQKSAMNIQ